MTVTGTGFLPGERVSVVLHSDPIPLGTTTADANGAIRLSWTVPANLPQGEHRVVLSGATSGEVSTTFTHGSLPGTGVTPFIGRLAVAGALFLALAAVSLLIASRRRLDDPT
jgi:hypothetical protein